MGNKTLRFSLIPRRFLSLYNPNHPDRYLASPFFTSKIIVTSLSSVDSTTIECFNFPRLRIVLLVIRKETRKYYIGHFMLYNLSQITSSKATCAHSLQTLAQLFIIFHDQVHLSTAAGVSRKENT